MTENYIKTIAGALKKKSCVVFFGSGISIDSGLPTGGGLIKHLLDLDEDTEISNFDLAKIAQIQRHKHKGHPNWLIGKLGIALRTDKGPNDLHRLLVMLDSKYYITTNYDQLFDSVLETYYGVKYPLRIVSDDDISKDSDVIYIKLHGDILENEGIVLTYEDYESKFEKNPNLVHLLYSLFAQNLVLFVGYSLKDPNILSVVYKVGRRNHKGMYIVLPNPKKDDIDFLDSLNVKVIPLECSGREEIGAKLKQWLLELWNETVSYDLYLGISPDSANIPFESRIPLAVQTYNNGDYIKAKQQFQQILKDKKESKKDDEITWRKRPDLFGQLAYFTLKTMDKLNEWDELEAKSKYFLDDLEKFNSIYGQDITALIKNQINSSVGTALMRYCRYEKAYAVIKQVLGTQPLGSYERKEVGALIGDRYVVLANICLCLFLLSDDTPEEMLQKAEEAFSKATEIFMNYNYTKGGEDIHYLGRYYGTGVFLQIAAHKFNTGKDLRAEELLEKGKSAHSGKRKEYGRIAGKYCHGMAYFYVGLLHKAANNPEQAGDSFKHAEAQWQACLSLDEKDPLSLSTLDTCKIYTALSRLYSETGNIEKLTGILSEIDKEQQALVKTGVDEKIILNENWIFTPLN